MKSCINPFEMRFPSSLCNNHSIKTSESNLIQTIFCLVIILTWKIMQKNPKSNLYILLSFRCHFLAISFCCDVEGLRQERPPHLRGEHIHPAMIERGRAIPSTQSVPIINDKPQRSQDNVQIIDGRVSFLSKMELFLSVFFHLYFYKRVRQTNTLFTEVLYHDPHIS